MTGRIVILNGVPRAGKTSIARAIQERFEGVWVNMGVDAYMPMIPARFQPGIGLRPGGERRDIEPLVPLFYAGLYEAIAAHARLGLNVVADVGHHEGHSRGFGILRDCATRLAGLPVLFVGVRAPVETIMARRNAEPREGFYASGPGVPEPVQRWQDAVHAHGIYDLEVDTSLMRPEEAADAIRRALGALPAPSAFERIGM